MGDDAARGDVAGHQGWRNLLFLHWPVEPDLLRARLPRGVSLDLHRGTAYLGLVAFGVVGARPSLLPRALGLRFLETNLRTYVRRADGGPGVYFFSMDATSRLAVWSG